METEQASIEPIDQEDENPFMAEGAVSKREPLDGEDQDDPDAEENDEESEQVKDDGIDQA